MTTLHSPTAHRPWRIIGPAVALSATFVPAAFVIIYGIRDEPARIFYNDILFPIYGMAIAAVFAVAARHASRHSAAIGRAWWVLMAAQLLWALGDLVWAVLEVGLQIEPYPSMADALYLTYYAAFLSGTLLLPTERPSRLDRAKRVLDSSVVVVAASALFWVFWLGPLAEAADASDPLTLFYALAYPVGDLVLIWSTLALLLRPLRAQPRWPLVLLGLSAVIGAAADVTYTHQVMNDTYVSGSLVDLGWLAVMTFSMWAAALQAAAPDAAFQRTPAATERTELTALTLIRLALPYVAVLGAFGLMFFVQHAAPEASAQSGLVDAAVVVMVLAISTRQILTLAENARLSARLRAELSERGVVEVSLREEIVERRRVEEALRASQQQLLHDAVHDSLTGLPNRVLMLDRLERSVERGKRNPAHRFAVLYLDFDGFKLVNDSLGHPMGDRLLVLASGRLQRCVRSADTVARLGGDEFVLLLDDIRGVEDAISAAERIQALFAESIDLDGRVVSLTASIGIVVSGAGLHAPDDIIRNADIAMYEAKQTGKARHVLYEARMGAQALARMDLESALRGAIERQEFRLHYQPIVAAQSRRLVGFEALLRWRHPRLGEIPPGDFIPIAEETGLIVPIGRAVLSEACRQMAEWKHSTTCRYSPCSISINLSARQFRQPDLVDDVAKALAESGLEPADLNLEVTESMLIGDAGQAAATMRSLRALGVNLHIDDFGTGYSSLSYLHQFPINTLKIDRVFVADLSATGRNRRLVDNIVTLAHDLGLTVVAEGVETTEQADLIAAIGCEHLQGFAFSRPLDAAQVPAFVERYRSQQISLGVTSTGAPR